MGISHQPTTRFGGSNVNYERLNIAHGYRERSRDLPVDLATIVSSFPPWLTRAGMQVSTAASGCRDGALPSVMRPSVVHIRKYRPRALRRRWRHRNVCSRASCRWLRTQHLLHLPRQGEEPLPLRLSRPCTARRRGLRRRLLAGGRRDAADTAFLTNRNGAITLDKLQVIAVVGRDLPSDSVDQLVSIG